MRGDIELGFCKNCGLVWNTAFDPKLLEYSTTYEATQMLSPVFRKYAGDVARYLVQKYDLHGKSIIELGCGDGSFLKLLAELGHNRGIGFDPSWRSNSRVELPDSVRIVADYFSDRYAEYQANLVCSRHVLEHIPDPVMFLNDLNRVTRTSRPIFFFEVPNVSWSLRKGAFWDIYYEHCLYFASPSLTYAFAHCGFNILRLSEGFGGQYLMIESMLTPSREGSRAKLDLSKAVQQLAFEIESFSTAYESMRARLKREVDSATRRDEVVVWGAGAKAVSFLNLLSIRPNQIEFVIDINPRKWGAYIPGTGQEIVGPDFLVEHKPDLVLVMNPEYESEIAKMVKGIGSKARIWAIGKEDEVCS